jgi:RsiW-degrading membrane proteinase PrsW (M82 family)
MDVLVLLSGIIAPALFWSGYLYYKDRYRPEPLLKFGSCYLLGLAAAGACLGAYRLLELAGAAIDPSALMETGGWKYLGYSITATGLVEELFKLLPFVLVAVRFRSFDEKTDGIIYASAIALGFASFENLRALSVLGGWELWGRAVASPLTHAVFASIWGYKVGLARIRKKPLWMPAALGLAMAAAAHGLFNFFTVSPELRLGAALGILGVWIWIIRVLEKAAPKRAQKGLPGG